MKNLMELVKRFPILIAAMILALLSVYKDYSDHEKSSQIYDVKSAENLNSNSNALSGKLVGKGFAGNSIEIIKVIDGDSLRIRIGDSSPLDVRLYGIDAPEYGQKYGKEAHDFLSKAITKNPIKKLEIIDMDRYGRAVAILYLADGVSAQEELLKNGMAWYYKRFCKIESLCLNFEVWAKNAKNANLGLWADISPQAPWNWKRKN